MRPIVGPCAPTARWSYLQHIRLILVTYRGIFGRRGQWRGWLGSRLSQWNSRRPIRGVSLRMRRRRRALKVHPHQHALQGRHARSGVFELSCIVADALIEYVHAVPALVLHLRTVSAGGRLCLGRSRKGKRRWCSGGGGRRASSGRGRDGCGGWERHRSAEPSRGWHGCGRKVRV